MAATLSPALAAWLFLLVLSTATPVTQAQTNAAALAPEVASGRTEKAIGFGRRDLVVAAHPLAVEAGVEMLAAGGSALDAAIAAQWMLGLVEPQSSGLGGGALMLHRDALGHLEAWDGRETAPMAARADQMLDAQGKPLPKPASIDNGRSVGVPGVVAMLEAAHRRHGRLPWARLVEPALRVAETGFPVSPRLHTQIRAAQARMRAQGEPIASYFLDARGEPRAAGTLLRNPDYAQTLRLLAREGARVFHEGEIAQAIVDKVRAHPVRPGVMTLDDLRQYRPRVREPVCGPYRGLRLCFAPPPSAGGIAILQILGMLEATPSDRLSMRTPESLHLITEAQRLAWADRTQHVADDQFITVPVAGLLAPDYLRERARRIQPDRSLGSVEAGRPEGAATTGADGHEGQDSTTHLSVVDAEGAAVSLTSSIEAGFGSLQMVRGFLLNNQLTDFSPQPADAQGRLIANRLEPGKRPRSAMSPTFVLDARGRLEAALGSPGGPAIVHYLSKTLIGLIDGHLPLQQAIDLPHFGAMNSPLTFLEKGGFDDPQGAAIVAGLKARGHRVREFELNSGLHALVFNGRREDGQPGRFALDPDRGQWAGAADPRREGLARGSP